MIVLLHTYSRKNRGDGLLVDLALDLIHKTLGKDTPVTMVAADAASFSDLPSVLQVPGPAETRTPRKALAVLKNLSFVVSGALTGRCNFMELNDLLPQTKLIMGVGGAYLRGGHPRETLATAAVQLPQLLWAAHAGKPTLYLPQSIGPLNRVLTPVLIPALSKIDHVFVRDDRTKQEVGPTVNTVRCPDMALLEIGQKLPRETDTKMNGKTYIVARDLPRTPEVRAAYIAKLQALRKLLPDAEPVVQSRGRGNDDAAFYQAIGWGAPRDINTAVAQDGPGVMVAVRLHGALQSILEGCPTVHLTYERKGFGAYDDLGISPYLHTATSFDPQTVARQVQELHEGAPFWSLIAKKIPDIQASYKNLQETLVHAI